MLKKNYWPKTCVWAAPLMENEGMDLDAATDPVVCISQVIGYRFVNENFLRQAFTRRTFQIEYGLSGCSEELEFLGDSILNTVVTRELVKAYSSVENCRYYKS